MSIIEPIVYNKDDIEHKSVVIELHNDPAVRRVFYDFEYYVNSMISNKEQTSVEKAYVVKIDGVYVGMIMFNILDGMHEISYAVLPQYRHRGYGTMMISYFIDYLFSLENINKIVVNIRKDNLYSIKVALSLGFEKVDDSKYIKTRSLS